jgi:hypothetical protein
MSMEHRVPKQLIAERPSLEAEIRAAFKHVTRERGISWSETEVFDAYGSEEEREAARAKDHDRDWTQLAEDRTWDIGPGVGGISFLETIGYRYYLPAAMIRTLHDPTGAATSIGLDIILHWGGVMGDAKALHIALNDRQRRCVARFVKLMADCGDDEYGYRDAFESYRKSVL